MAKRVKVSRKELLKEPDQFLTTTEKAAIFFGQYRFPLLISTGVVFGVLALIWGFKYNQQVESLRMEKLYFQVEKVHNEQFKDNPQKTLSEMEKVIKDFKDGPQKMRANLLLAGGYFRDGQFDKAIGLYQKILEQNGHEKISYQLARVGLAQSYEGKKDYGKAIEVYKSIIENSGSYPLFDVYIGLARSYELNKDHNNALLTLREANNKFQGHPQLEMIERRIQKLSGQA